MYGSWIHCAFIYLGDIVTHQHTYFLKHQLITKAAQPLEPVTPASAHTRGD